MDKRPADYIKEKNGNVSSEALEQVTSGRVYAFMQEMGKAYSISGMIVEGNKIGRTLGYPTANLDPDTNTVILPGQGVYTAMVHIGSQWYESMVNVGIRPTLNLKQVTIEAHLFGASGNLYGERMSVHLLEKLRDEMRFSSLAELKEQLDMDRDAAQKAIAAMRPHLTCTASEMVYSKSS